MRFRTQLVLPCLVATTLCAGMPPIVSAAYNSDFEALKTLIASKTDLNAVDEYGWTALHYAVYQREETLVKLLLDAGANPNIGTTRKWANGRFIAGTTPLGIAAFYGFTDLAEQLIAGHADVKQENSKFQTPLMIAKDCECWGVVEILEPGHTEGFCKTLAEAARTDDFMAAAHMVAQKNIWLDETNDEGMTALHRAVVEGSNRVALILIKAGANPNACTNRNSDKFGAGATPLHFAASYDRRAVIVPLLQAKADSARKTQAGYTALDMAKKNKYKEIIQLLSEGAPSPK